MAKRHTTIPNSLENLYIRLEEIILANSGEDEFEEILKVLVCKLWIEFTGESNIIYETELNYDIVTLTNKRLTKIAIQWPSVLCETSIKINKEQLEACFRLLENHRLLSFGFEAIDMLFEFIISKEKKGSKGQYFTPRYIVNFCIDLIRPRNGEVILDPAAGSGAFLYHSARYIMEHMNPEDNCKFKLFAFDFDDKAIRVSKLLMYVAKISNYKIFKVNSLLTNQAQIDLLHKKNNDSITTIEDYLRLNKAKNQVDIILTNPPFAGEIIEPELLNNYEVATGKQRIERDILFIERCISLLKPNGRMAIILPDNVFGSVDNADLRRWIHSKANIIGIIGLPRNTFMPHTPVKTSILLLKKRSGQINKNEEIFFGISEVSGKDNRGNLQYISNKERSWKNVSHDLRYIEHDFKGFIDTKKVSW